MQTATKVGIALGVGAGLVVTGGVITAARAAREDTSPGDDPAHVPSPYPAPYPGGGTAPGDAPIAMPIRGHVDPPGFWDDYGIDGALSGDRLDATMDPRGWGNDIRLRGRVDYGGFRTEVDPAGWSNSTRVEGRRSGSGFRGTVDRPGLWNDVNHVISETVRGATVLREGRFDEPLTPGFSEASWRSSPIGSGIEGRLLEFDPPGWGNTTRVTLDSNAPAGAEATIAAALFDQWKTEVERQAEYPDPAHPGGTAPGDDRNPDVTSPGDEGGVYDPYPVPTMPDDMRWPGAPHDDYPIV